MSWPGRDHLPVDLGSEWFHRARDLDRLSPGQSVVAAFDDKAPHVFDTIEQMHRPVARGDSDRIVDSLLVGTAHVLRFLLLRHMGIARQSLAQVRDLDCRRPCLPAIGAAPKMNLDFTTVGFREFASFAVGQHRTVRRHDHAWNTIQFEAAGIFFEQDRFGELIGGGHWCKRQ